MNITAKVVPFSSVVGSSVTLHDETGKVVCQLALLNTWPITDDAAEWKRRQTSFAEEIAARLNAPQPSADLPGKDVGVNLAAKALVDYLHVEKARHPSPPYGTLQLRTGDEQYSHILVIANNSYTEAALNSMAGLIDTLSAALVSQPHPEGEAVAFRQARQRH